MKITDESPERLVIVIVPWTLIAAASVFVVASVFGLVTNWQEIGLLGQALGLAWLGALFWGINFFVHRVEVTFSRNTDRLEIRRRGITNNIREVYPLHHFQLARVEGDNDEEVTQRIVLQFDEKILDEFGADFWTKKERRKVNGFQLTAPNEVPLTNYYASIAKTDEIAGRINGWADTWLDQRRVRQG